jgi:hypothetical protein
MDKAQDLQTEQLPQEPLKSLDQIEAADLVVGILADLSQDGVAELCGALRTLQGNPKILVLQSFPVTPSTSAESSQESPSIFLLPWALQAQNLSSAPFETVSTAYNSIVTLGEKVGARGCCLIVSHFESPASHWICQLVAPLLDGTADFVAPRYAFRKFEGLLNSSIISPLTRSLYGRRMQSPMGPDFGLSQQLFHTFLSGSAQNGDRSGGVNMLAALAPRVACGNFRISQAYLGARTYPPADWTIVSALLSQVLGPIFLVMEKTAACWQKARNSTPIRTLNEPAPVPQTTANVEIGHLVNSFQLGVRDLQEIWSLVLPPATLIELRKLSRLAPEQFRLPDELWARIIYDFALAHRLRTINRDHLLRSLTPLYLGWVASYAREMESSDSNAAEQRLERLAVAFETAKPYLVSRWRWPDRFNP